MVSACISWHGATKPFFVNGKNLKVNAQRYKKHLEKQLIPGINSMLKRKDCIFVQDSAPSLWANILKTSYRPNCNEDTSNARIGHRLHQMVIRWITIFGMESKTKFTKIALIRILKTRKRWSNAYERFGQKWQARLMRYGRLSENLFLGFKVLKTMIDKVSRCFFGWIVVWHYKIYCLVVVLGWKLFISLVKIVLKFKI